MKYKYKVNGLDCANCTQKLEDALKDAQNLREALQKKKQKLFTNNILICIQAASSKELQKTTKVVRDIAGEYSIELYNLDWQQIEGLQNSLVFGWNNLQIQRSLTSESTATNVPFNTKDLMHPNSIFYGINLVSKNPVFCDRKKLLNGNRLYFGNFWGAENPFLLNY